MISTEKVSLVTSLTVSRTPSSATEPLVATKRIKSFGARSGSRAMSGRSSREIELRRRRRRDRPRCGRAELVADLHGALEIEPRAHLPVARRGEPQRVSAAASTDTAVRIAELGGFDHTVRQTPECEIDAPMAMDSTG